MGKPTPQYAAGPPDVGRTDHSISVRSLAKAVRRQSLFVSLTVALILTGYANGQPATTAARPLASISTIEETAHLKLIHNGRSHVHVFRGSITGTFDMTITATFHNHHRYGSFEAVAPKGTLFGDVEITSTAQIVRPVTTVLFEANGAIDGGTRAYRGYYSRHLKISGTAKRGGVIDMRMRGRLHRDFRGGRRWSNKPSVR